MLRPGPDRGSDVGGATASFPVALTIGITYVFGMVTPLAVIRSSGTAATGEPAGCCATVRSGWAGLVASR